jgi:hypothetical protein
MTGQLGLRIGLAVIGFGVLLDAVAHGVSDPASAHLGHVVVIVGMVLSLAGVVIDGTRHSVRPEPAVAEQEVSRALR